MSNLTCAETHKSKEKNILQVSPRKREAETPESGMATRLMAVTATPQVQDVQDTETSAITDYLLITGYAVILPRKPRTKLRESFTWFAHLCVVSNGAALCCVRVPPALLAPVLGLFCFFWEFRKAESTCLIAVHLF